MSISPSSLSVSKCSKSFGHLSDAGKPEEKRQKKPKGASDFLAAHGTATLSQRQAFLLPSPTHPTSSSGPEISCFACLDYDKMDVEKVAVLQVKRQERWNNTQWNAIKTITNGKYKRYRRHTVIASAKINRTYPTSINEQVTWPGTNIDEFDLCRSFWCSKSCSMVQIRWFLHVKKTSDGVKSHLSLSSATWSDTVRLWAGPLGGPSLITASPEGTPHSIRSGESSSEPDNESINESINDSHHDSG